MGTLLGMFFEHVYSDEERFIGVFSSEEAAINTYISNKNKLCINSNLIFSVNKYCDNSYIVSYKEKSSTCDSTPSIEGYISFKSLSVNEIFDLDNI